MNFGNIIDGNVPVLIMFFIDAPQFEVENGNVYSDMRDIAAYFGKTAKIIKIDISKNQELTEALYIKHNPTYLVYYKGKQLTRRSKKMTQDDLITLLKPLI